MALTQADEDAAVAQLLTGVRRVVIDGREVEYHGPTDQLAIVQWIRSQRSTRPRQTLVVASKGFD